MSQFNQPLGGNEMPRFAGIASMFRLPVQNDARGLDVAICGVPLDLGTSNRVGTRYGPRQIRTESVLVRPYGMATGAAPFDSFQVADIGDVALNTYNLLKSIDIIEVSMTASSPAAQSLVTLGGDHTLAPPIPRALAKKHGPLALAHVDAHADVNEHDVRRAHHPRHGIPLCDRGEPDRSANAWRTACVPPVMPPNDSTGHAQQGARVPAEERWVAAGAADGGSARADRDLSPDGSQFRYRRTRPLGGAGHGTPEPGGLSALRASR